MKFAISFFEKILSRIIIISHLLIRSEEAGNRVWEITINTKLIDILRLKRRRGERSEISDVSNGETKK